MAIVINETDRLKLLSQIKKVREDVDELKRDLKSMRYFEIELESGERKVVREDEIEIVSDPQILKQALKRWPKK